MKIKMLKFTNISSGPVKPGDEIEVDNVLGSRLCKNGIAEAVEVEEIEAETDIGEVDEPLGDIDLNKMSPKDLFEICKEQNIELDKEMINGKTAKEKRDYLISMIQGE